MLHEVYDIDSFVYSNIAVKIWLLLLQSLTLKHTLAKRIRCEIQTPLKRERGTSPSRNVKLTISKLKSSHSYEIYSCKNQEISTSIFKVKSNLSNDSFKTINLITIILALLYLVAEEFQAMLHLTINSECL